MAFRGSNEKIGDRENGNFLGSIELLSKHNSILKEHVEKVKAAQSRGERLQVHYLSSRSQNEFIHSCANLVKSRILEEREEAKYYSIMVDGTPDVSHKEQTTFILRYLTKNDGVYEVQERFLEYFDCCKKSGSDIADIIFKVLDKNNIPLDDCRGQGYDNAANMSGAYKGVQSIIKTHNPLCIYSPCGCHSLNLCGADSAECCDDATSFFSVVQSTYNLFASSPQR